MTIFINDSNQKTATLVNTPSIDITSVLFPPGANRVGLLAVMAEDDNVTDLVPTSVQIDPGGVDQANFVKAVDSTETSSSFRNSVSIWYLPEADIPNVARTIRVTFAIQTLVVRFVTGVTLNDVDQANPVDATAAVGSSVASHAALSQSVTIRPDSAIINTISIDANSAPAQDGAQVLLEAFNRASPTLGTAVAYEVFGAAGGKTQGWTFAANNRSAMALAAFKEAPGTSHQQQIRRGKKDAVAAFTGAPGEMIWNIDDKRIHGQDGFTQGGVQIPSFMDIHNNLYKFAAVSGTADAIALALTPSSASLTSGMQVWWIQSGTNIAAVTINLDGHGAISLRKTGAVALLAPGDLIVGQVYTAIYDGTFWQLPQGSSGSGSVSLTKIVAFTATGTYNKPAGVTKAKVTVIGGGGGGGSNSGGSGGGGGTGGLSVKLIDLTGVNSVSVTVGAGGSGGSIESNGGAGGTTSFGSFVSASGGGGGSASNGVGGSGGIGSNGDLNFGGQAAYKDWNTVSLSFVAGGNKLLPSNHMFGTVGAGGRGGSNAIQGVTGIAGIVVIEEFS